MPTARVECQFYLISQFPADNRNAQYVGVQYTAKQKLYILIEKAKAISHKTRFFHSSLTQTLPLAQTNVIFRMYRWSGVD